MQYLKQATTQDIILGPVVDATDGVTPLTGLTLSASDVLISVNGNAIDQITDTTDPTHDMLGFYLASLNATDTDTLGRLLVILDATGACPLWQEYMVVPANVYDSLFGSDKLQVDAVQVEGTDATDALTAAVPTAAQNRTEMDNNSTKLAAIVADTNELQTDWVNGGRLDALIDSIKAETATILADTNELQTDLTNGGRLDLLIDAIKLAADNALKADTSYDITTDNGTVPTTFAT